MTDQTNRNSVTVYRWPEQHYQSTESNDVCRIFHQKQAEYTSLSSLHGMFIKIGHIHQDRPHSRHKANFNNCKRIEITQSMLSSYGGSKLDISNKKMAGKSPNIWKLQNADGKNCWWKKSGKTQIKSHIKFKDGKN